MSSALDPSDRALSVSAGESSRLRRRPAVVLRTPASGPVSIFCGSQDAINSQNISEYDYDEHRAWSVQILPEEEGPPPTTREFRSSRSNGCGAEVHSSVCMMRRNQCWYGSKEDLAANVIPLERSYFPTDLAQLLDLRHDEPAACGCALSGLGCAVCGNPLGVAQYVCATHSSRGTSMAGPTGYIFAASAVSASEAPPTAHQNSEVPTGSSLPTWNTQIPHNGDIIAASRSLPSPPTPTTPGMRFPSSPPGYVSFIPPSTPPSFIPTTTPTSASTTSFVPPTTTSFVPPTTIPTSPGAGAGTTTATAPGDFPPRPRRRRTLRTPESVEQYFGGDPSVSVGAGGGGGARFASTGTGTVASSASIPSLPFIPSASLPLPLSLSPTSSSPSSAVPPTPTSAGGVSSSSFPADLQRNMVQLFGRETSPMPSPGLPVWGYESGSGSPGANTTGNTNSGNMGNSNNGGTAATENRPSPSANPSTSPRTVTEADAAALRWGSWRPYPWDDAVRWVASQGGGGGAETTGATRDTTNNTSNEEMPPLDPDTASLPPPLTTRSGNMLFPSRRDNSNTLPPPTNPSTNTNRNSLPSIRDLALSFDRSFPPPPPPPPHPHQHHHHHYPPHPPHPHTHAHHHHHHHAHSPLPTTFAPPPAPGLPLPQPQPYAHPPPPVHPHPQPHGPALPIPHAHWPTHPLPPGATNARVREIVEQHLDVLGVRAAALDAAAANVRQHIEALRMDAAARAAGAGSNLGSSVNGNVPTTAASTTSTATTTSTPSSPPAPAPSLEGQEAAVAAATRAGLLREARADLRAAMATRRNTYTAGFGAETLQSNQANPLLPPGSALRTEPPTTAAALRETIAARENQAREMRLMIAEERTRLSELQARLMSYGEGGPSASSLPSSSASSNSTLVPSASSSSTTLVNTATTTSRSPTEQPSIADIRAIVRQQTALLSRVSNLISDVGTQMGELEGNRAAATMLARVRETVDRHAGTIRSASGVLAGMVDNNNNNVDIQSALWRSERLAALAAAPAPGTPSSAVVDMDAVRTMEANAQRFLADAQRAAAALGAGVEVSSSPSADAGHGTPAQGEEDKQPAPPRRRTFFER
ncbi:hypothetical protein R3P38DRAFT_1956204 [Favolaschia claudopus]|uniref:Uncharacterized protein n=1 Tax=Favolaschia claudopus TaxID=2862362 RepID=A0AAV9ZZS0_9AGAR